MNGTKSQLTVFFEDPFWVGVYEREETGTYEVCKITFGTEPKDAEVYELLLKKRHRLCFHPMAQKKRAPQKRANPKRTQRQITHQLQSKGTGTKAQQALKRQQEAGKQKRKTCKRQQQEEKRERHFQLRQEKRKEKHRGH